MVASMCVTVQQSRLVRCKRAMLATMWNQRAMLADSTVHLEWEINITRYPCIQINTAQWNPSSSFLVATRRISGAEGSMMPPSPT